MIALLHESGSEVMANATGRPIAPLILSSDERAYLERQVRRHRVARSLSERCRVILRCADGVASKDVAAELGLHEHTVGKWRRRFLKDRCDGLLDEARPGRLEESTTRLLSRDPDRMRALLRHSVIVESPTPHCRHRRAVRLNEQLRLQ